jgi:hypothetical protein
MVEGNSGTPKLVFTISLDRASSFTVRVSYATNNLSTTAADYVTATGGVTIPAGSRSATVSVTIKPDLVREPNETMRLQLSSPARATIADNSGNGVILNDD